MSLPHPVHSLFRIALWTHAAHVRSYTGRIEVRQDASGAPSTGQIFGLVNNTDTGLYVLLYSIALLSRLMAPIAA